MVVLWMVLSSRSDLTCWFLSDGPLRRLSISLQKSVDHLDRVLAGYCWEVHATRADSEKSLSSLRQVSKRLTMLLAVNLAKEVAAILRILSHPTKKLYDDHTALSFALIIRHSPSTKNCCIHRHVQCNKKG